MKEEFDFNKVKKEMPYQVPAGFFENITQDTLDEVKRRQAQSAAKELPMWSVLSVAAGLAVLLVTAYFLLLRPSQTHTPQMARKTTKETTPPTPAPVKEAEPMMAQVEQEEPAPIQAAPLVKAPVATKQHAKVAEKPKKEMKPESLENLLATLTDEEVAQLAAIAESESYVYGEPQQ